MVVRLGAQGIDRPADLRRGVAAPGQVGGEQSCLNVAVAVAVGPVAEVAVASSSWKSAMTRFCVARSGWPMLLIVVYPYFPMTTARRSDTTNLACGFKQVSRIGSAPDAGGSRLLTLVRRASTIDYGHTPSHPRTLSTVDKCVLPGHFQYPDSQSLWSF